MAPQVLAWCHRFMRHYLKHPETIFDPPVRTQMYQTLSSAHQPVGRRGATPDLELQHVPGSCSGSGNTQTPAGRRSIRRLDHAEGLGPALLNSKHLCISCICVCIGWHIQILQIRKSPCGRPPLPPPFPTHSSRKPYFKPAPRIAPRNVHHLKQIPICLPGKRRTKHG